ncbi:MAG TPA: HAMP domain-containing histidine kinase [Candidatus Blautia faecigallinarum]|uniref:histidine kinase n=1 Tax=Candidatus Blautia faecigallinarum TaxID=2838488 RepID=A0A9D2DT78_9FIRM|nr:HAMP domain-containing histidine kinase [Candidatus Blautia faecigallinarum]
MNKALYLKFLAGYLIIAVFGFFIVTAGGSILVEQRLEHSISEDLYQEAHTLAENDIVKNDISSSSVEEIREALSLIANYKGTSIWVINSDGEIILSTRTDISPSAPISIQGFDATQWGGNYYQIGDFYGYFDDVRLSVIAPITSEMTTRGYVAIHYPISSLYEERAGILLIIQILFLCIYLLTFLLGFIYRRYIHRPLEQITKGASEYANGNLSYRIPVTSEDEMGYLANTLNYMSDKLNRNGEYQRKFISNVSHDFRSPLTSIKGYVNAMLDGTIPPQMQEKYLKIIAYESSRLEKLTQSLLTLNELDIQKRTMHMRRFDINEVIKTTAATFEGICTKRKILLELILSGKELYARADMEQIQQVLYNLLDNAVKFSNDNSTIVLETTEKSGKIFVSIKDHGVGIPKESIPKIWERFYKTDASRGKDRKGTGLGLSIVKEIIHAHGQNINVISTPDVGTEFIFTLEKAKEK